MKARLDSIWAEAQRRQDAGEPIRRAPQLGYTPPPGDSDMGLIPWMTEAELAEAHQITQDLAREQRIYDSQAHERLLEKHAARRAS
jgi:hypothetical protein